MGIEPTSKAWEALVLPLNYARFASSRRRTSDSPTAVRVSLTPRKNQS
jgi:hypothetical protein